MNGGGRKKKVTLCQWAHAYFIRRHELASGRELRCFDHLGEIIVLFSALEQTHYAIIACDSDSDSRMWLVWLAFLLQFKKNKKYRSKWSTYNAILLLRGRCRVKLLQSRRTFCVHHITMHQFTVPLHSKPHRLRKVYNVFSFNLPPIIFGRMTGTFYVLHGIGTWSQLRKLAMEKNILPLLPGLEHTTFWSRVLHSNHWVSPVLQIRLSVILWCTFSRVCGGKAKWSFFHMCKIETAQIIVAFHDNQAARQKNNHNQYCHLQLQL